MSKTGESSLPFDKHRKQESSLAVICRRVLFSAQFPRKSTATF